MIVSWSPSLHSIHHYVVSIEIQYLIRTLLTVLQHLLLQGMNYSYSVTGVDGAERTGEES